MRKMTKSLTRDIYLVDHDPLSDARLRDLLAGELFSIRTFLNGASFEAAIEDLKAGIVLLNVRLPDRDDLLLLHHICRHRPDLPVIALCDGPDLPAAVNVMRNGAEFCLAKPIERDLLFTALFELSQMQERTAIRKTAAQIEARLTQRQFQVLKLLLAGLQNKRVGAALGISERTVEIHRSKIMRQLDVDNFASLVRLATQCGITPD